ncbi:hypothetical protein GF322_02940 [Candidatus Dependentiae bacterium]|nr:hypothetical protein [Candidatus Dependentiae bacterium]
MYLLKKWQESLEVFKGNNIKLFFLATINVFYKALLTFFKYFWWLYLYYFLFTLIFREYLSASFSIWCWSRDVGFLLGIFCLIYFLFFLSIRPSVENKNFFYFILYSKRILEFLPLFLLLLISLSFCPNKYMQIIILNNFFIPVNFFSCKSIIIFNAVVFPVVWFSSFFLLDVKQSFEKFFLSLIRGIKLIVLYLPFISITSFVYAIIYFFLPSIHLKILLDVFFMCMFSVYYTKVKHKDFNVFFKK